jgi:hypothetical protein
MRLASAFAVLAIVGTAVSAAVPPAFSNAVAEFAEALSHRLDYIENLAGRTREESKEFAALARVEDGVEFYLGGSERKDLAAIVKALATAGKSSGDAGVRSAGADLLAAFDDLCEGAEDGALAERDMITWAPAVEMVDRMLAKAGETCAQARAEADWGKAAKLFVKAYFAYVKAEALAALHASGHGH